MVRGPSWELVVQLAWVGLVAIRFRRVLRPIELAFGMIPVVGAFYLYAAVPTRRPFLGLAWLVANFLVFVSAVLMPSGPYWGAVACVIPGILLFDARKSGV